MSCTELVEINPKWKVVTPNSSNSKVVHLKTLLCKFGIVCGFSRERTTFYQNHQFTKSLCFNLSEEKKPRRDSSIILLHVILNGSSFDNTLSKKIIN